MISCRRTWGANSRGRRRRKSLFLSCGRCFILIRGLNRRITAKGTHESLKVRRKRAAAMRGCCSAGSFPNNRRPFAAQPKCRLSRSASKRRNCIIKKLSKRAKMPHGRFWANFTFSAAAVRGCIPKIALKKRWNSSNLRRRAAMLPRRSCWRRCTETMFTMNRLSMCNGCLKWAC